MIWLWKHWRNHLRLSASDVRVHFKGRRIQSKRLGDFGSSGTWKETNKEVKDEEEESDPGYRRRGSLPDSDP